MRVLEHVRARVTASPLALAVIAALAISFSAILVKASGVPSGLDW